MSNSWCFCFLYFFLLKNIHCQNVTESCTVESSGSPGTCKLLTKCRQVRDELVKFNRLPQTCGFQETQPIVCCPEDKKPGTISQKKCKEYSSYASCEHGIVKRVAEGQTVTSRTKFPHMATLGYKDFKNIIRWLCAGSIISERFILTAAYCLSGVPKYAQMGVASFKDFANLQEIEISEIFVHPEYKKSGPGAPNDIGLVKLGKPIEFGSSARPACLYPHAHIPVKEAIATGWGRLDKFIIEKELMEVKLDLMDDKFCDINLQNDSARQICAGRENETKGPRFGDNGGPLQINHQNGDVECMFDIIGVITVGPSLYTRVSFYIKWIEDIVWPSDSS